MKRIILPLSLALSGALVSQSLSAGSNTPGATTGMCHYMTNFRVQNVTGYDMQYGGTSGLDNLSMHPPLPSGLTIPTGGTTGFSQAYNTLLSSVGGALSFTIQDGAGNPNFNVNYTAGTESSSLSAADWGATVGAEAGLGAAAGAGYLATQYYVTSNSLLTPSTWLSETPAWELEAGEYEALIPPPAGEALMAVTALAGVAMIAREALEARSNQAYVTFSAGTGTTFNTVSNVTTNTQQTQTVVVAGSNGLSPTGYALTATTINSGCPGTIQVSATPYCHFVCSNAASNGTPVDPGCSGYPTCVGLASAQPSGSWSASCTNAAWSSPTLTALCDTPSGTQLNANLNYHSCMPGSTVSNQNGVLACDVSLVAQPSGSYSQSCTSVAWNAPDLTASCLDVGGAYSSASLDYSTCASGSTVNNNNGSLVCDTPLAQPSLVVGASQPAGQPSGSYSQSCSSVVWNSPNLSASCLNSSGVNVSTSLNYSYCTDGSTVSNQNGALTCDTGCGAPTWNAPSLTALCTASGQSMQPYVIDYSVCSPGSTVGFNATTGQLVCQ